jgi:hypothetical protein
MQFVNHRRNINLRKASRNPRNATRVQSERFGASIASIHMADALVQTESGERGGFGMPSGESPEIRGDVGGPESFARELRL